MEYTDPHRTARRAGDDGGSTVDLGARNPLYDPTVRATVAAPSVSTVHRAAHEEHVRSRGKWLTISGGIIAAFTFAMTIVWGHGLQDDMPLAYMLPLYALALGAVSIGCMEYLSRPARQRQERMIDEVAQLRADLGFLVELMDSELQSRYWKGVAANFKSAATGTDNPRPTNRGRTGDVVQFRIRNDSPTG